MKNAILNDIHYSAKQLDPIDSTKKGDRARDRKKRQKKQTKKMKTSGRLTSQSAEAVLNY